MEKSNKNKVKYVDLTMCNGTSESFEMQMAAQRLLNNWEWEQK